MASSSSSASSAPAFYSQSWRYDVFVSFRGEDTRKTFVDHLYTALEQQGIHTYKDDVTLPRGESIGPSLIKAIEESQIAIIVFSENYADSCWCLDELAYIMKCKDTRGQIVMPIFYDVDPSVVRKQKQKYGKAFSKHELENNNKVESWRKALVDASNLAGWESKHIADGYESQGIKEIVGTISQKLQPLTSSANENLIGIAARMQDFKSKLQIGSGGVLMIGIWGVGGGGKTTLASSIYAEVSSKYDGCCFVKNIREESSKIGLEKLQEKIISEMDVNRVGGRHSINTRFRRRKVLIVLDDVDQLDQLGALAGSHDWFGYGSRIIITTRDEHLLNAHKVNVIHNISLLDDDEALKLLHKHAPGDYISMEDYELLSKDVVSYAGGLPLALTVLGSFLCDKDIHEWRSALARLKDIPDTNIVEKLKISFDGLKSVEQELFLDIACFFRGDRKDEKIMVVLDACGYHPVIGIKVLIQKALITISDGAFDMHDLVQEMGHYIVRGKHPTNPEKHSRVWKKEDVLEICAMDATADLGMIKALITYPAWSSSRLQIVANMNNLRWINWQSGPLHINFEATKLCSLIVYGKWQTQIWEGYKYLPNLRNMELYGPFNETPDFDGLPNLERFVFTGGECLEEIHPSIGRLRRLVFLSISGCSGLKMFPPITQLKKLETFEFKSCQLSKFSEIQQMQQNLNNSPHLPLDNGGKEVAPYKKSFTNLFVTCWTGGCSNLGDDTKVKKSSEELIGVECSLKEPNLPHNNMDIGLRFIPEGLRRLNLRHCGLGDEDIGSAVWDFPNLQKLDLGGNKFSRLNFSLMRLPRLKLLNVSYSHKLVELSELPSSIAVIIANDCDSLETFGDLSNCKWLWKVSLHDSYKLDPFYGDILLDSMLQGNAMEDHFINATLEHQIPKRFGGRLFWGKTFTMRLSDDWYNDFCGLLICIVTPMSSQSINIIIKQEVDEDSRFEIWQESNEATKREYDRKKTCVGYVSFGSLRHTTPLNSSNNMISFSIEDRWGLGVPESYFGAELVPRKNKGDQVQTTKAPADCSEFCDKEGDHGNTFVIKHDSKSSINIVWHPFNTDFS